MSPLKAALSLASILAFSLAAGAQTPDGVSSVGPQQTQIGSPAARSSPRTYGTASTVVHTIQSFQFIPLIDTTSYSGVAGNGSLRCLAGGCVFVAPLSLPAGSLVSTLQFEACDGDGGAGLDPSVLLLKIPAFGVGLSQLAFIETVGAPGCVLLEADLAAPETIDNQANTYAFQVNLQPAIASIRFFSVRVLYNLQVSPAPGVASFSDVPTGHAYFRFVEALVDAGITAGCGGGLYCVNAPVTRGEMAVFLAAALGLHFAP